MMDVDSDPGPRPDPEAEALGEEDTIKGLLRDYEATTRTVQQSAEENASASEAYCCELKQQLHEALDAVEQLREKLAQSERDLCSARELQSKQREEGSSSDVTEFLSSMACLTVDKMHGVDGESVYSCQVMDGRLAGHRFTLSLNQAVYEYVYTPVEGSKNLPSDSFLSCEVCFPDSMLSRFLLNLLCASYIDQ